MATFDVLLPVKNGVDYMREAIESIRIQTFQDWRLLVLDHGSSDGSLALAQACAEGEPRIKVLQFPHAVGLSGLLNLGLDLCDCEYVLRQDADDISLPQRMAVLADAYAADPELAVVGSLGDVIDAHGRKIGNIDMPTGVHGVAAAALFRTPVCHPTASMRLEKLRSLGARYGEDFLRILPSSRQLQVPGLAEDYFLFGQLALVARCRNLDRGLIKYRWHGGNVSATRYLEQMGVALTISRHLSDSLAALEDTDSVDPAPFCTHGESLFEIEGRSDFSADHLRLGAMLRKMLPDSADLRRELDFRHVLSVRRAPAVAARFLHFAARYSTRQTERRAIKSWLLRGLRRRPVLTLAASMPVTLPAT